MNLDLSPADEAFRAETRAFLDEHLTPDMRADAARGAGVWAEHELALRWQKILHQYGRVAPSWPKEHGGCEWSVVQRYIWDSENAMATAPRIPAMGLKMCGPVLMKYGTPEQKARFLPRILSGDDIWCQGYSEPGSGSDLASLQCRAERDGDSYVVNGTKIWTTYAQFSNWIFCLVRTNADGRPQEGISFLLIAMDSPGLTVQPIITLAGDHEVNQVFFDDVRVPVSNLVGDENQGWTVAKYLLEHERGGSFAAGMKRKLAVLKSMAADEPSGAGDRLIDDPDFACRLADAEIAVSGIDITEQRIISNISTGTAGPADPSFLKLRGTEMTQKLDELAVEAVGQYALPEFVAAREARANWAPGPDCAIPVVGTYFNNRAATIYGGSSEVQRNIMSKVLFSL
ncbi:MAG: acyl-CoA dehydrogenase family protein [Pseudomonadota bacterium]